MRCNCPVGEDPRSPCGAPAVKFFVASFKEGTIPRTFLHPRCPDHWERTALPTSPYVVELSEDEAIAWEIMSS